MKLVVEFNLALEISQIPILYLFDILKISNFLLHLEIAPTTQKYSLEMQYIRHTNGDQQLWSNWDFSEQPNHDLPLSAPPFY